MAVYVGTTRDPTLDARWTSQVGQDRTLHTLFNGKLNGYFIDLAANEAVYLSNTLTLEQQFGWNGLCIEANPSYHDMLLKRNCQVVKAAVGSEDNTEVTFFFNGGLGGIIGPTFDNRDGPGQVLKAVSLRNMFHYLQVPNVIDYMSLDIEGAEEWVFQTFPWAQYRFNIITAERPKPDLKSTLIQQGYIYICDHGTFGDELWIHNTFSTLDETLSKLNMTSTKAHTSQRFCA